MIIISNVSNRYLKNITNSNGSSLSETKKILERFTCCGGKFFFNLNSRPVKGLAGQNGNYNKYDSA